MKNLLIKLGLWEEKIINNDEVHQAMLDLQAMEKHFCRLCNRWFGDVRGKLMHDRHRHKENA